VIGLLLPAVAAGQVAVEDLEVHLRLRGAGEAVTQVIPIKNEQDRPQQVRISLGDWYRDSVGRNVFVAAGTTPGSCGERVQVFPTNLQIAAGATEMVRVAYTPMATDPGCWSVVFIETVSPPRAAPTGQGSHLTVEIRTGVKVYVHRPDATIDGTVESAEVGFFWRRADPRGSSRDTVQVREAVVRFANTGTGHLRVRTVLELRDSNAALVRSGDGPEYYVTPGAVVNMHFVIPALPPGDYVAIILLDYGDDEISAAQIDFRIP
jgi:P pilus assembly chaperone PapD